MLLISQFFVGVGVVYVVIMFIIVVDIVRVCIITNNQLEEFSSQSEGFVVILISLLF